MVAHRSCSKRLRCRDANGSARKRPADPLYETSSPRARVSSVRRQYPRLARHEPTTGEVDDAGVLRALEKLGYRGIVGCEYNPRAGTLEGLSWMKQLA